MNSSDTMKHKTEINQIQKSNEIEFKPIIKCIFGNGKVDNGTILVDTGASVSMVNSVVLKYAKYEIAGPRTQIYTGAGGSDLPLGKDLINLVVNIRNKGMLVVKNVVVCNSKKQSNTMLLGGPQIMEFGMLINYKSGMMHFNYGLLAGKGVQMKKIEKGQIIGSMQQIFQNMITMINQENDIMDEHDSSTKFKRKSSETGYDIDSDVPEVGDECIWSSEECLGCDRCINQDLSKLVKIESDMPPISDNPNVDNRTIMMSYIERLRQRERMKFTHKEVTIDEEFSKNDPELTEAIKLLLERHKQVFAGDIGCLGPEYEVNGKMVGKTSHQRPGHNELEGNILIAALKQLSRLIANGVLVSVKDAKITPINQLMLLPVKKKDDDGKVLEVLSALRIVVDSRPANGQTLFSGTQTDNLNDALSFATKMSSSPYAVKADIADAYYVIPLAKDLWPYFCINIPLLGNYCFVRVPQGWAPAAQICQEVMSKLFFPLWKNLRKYMDDVALAVENKDSSSREVFLKKFDQFLKICKRSGLRLKGKKMFIGSKKFNYLGFRVENGKLKASPHYVLKLKDVKWEDLTTKGKLLSFIMSIRYLARFQHKSTDILYILNQAAKGDNKEKVVWTEELKREFQRVKLALDELSELHPFESELETVVVVDTSKTATGGFVYQIGQEGPQLVAFYRRTRRDKERKIPISSCHMEMLGLKCLIWALLPMLKQAKLPITVVTDSRSVVKVFDKFRRQELPSHDIVLNNALYAIISVLVVNVVHAKNNNINLSFADDLSRLGLLKTAETCEGKPKCSICAAADPDNEERGAYINAINDSVGFGTQCSNIIANDGIDSVEGKSDKLLFQTKVLTMMEHQGIKHLDTKDKLENLMNDSERLKILQDQVVDLRMLKRGLKAGIVSFPLKQQRLQTLLVTRNAELIDGVVWIDKVIDGVVHRVIPVPNSAAQVVINAVHNTIGHTSATQIIKQVSRHFQFEKIREQVKSFTDRCVKCVLHRGGGKYEKDKMKATPLPTKMHQTILVDEIMRTFRNENIKMLIAMEALSGFIVVIIYKGSMDGAKFVQLLTQIRVCLSPNQLSSTTMTVRCDKASWHVGHEVQAALAKQNIEVTIHQSTTMSKNIIPELDVRIKVYSQYLVQLIESSSHPLEVCCHLAAAKCNNSVSQTGYTPAEMFIGRGWRDGNQIVIDAKHIIEEIRRKREDQRTYKERKKLEMKMKEELKMKPYKTEELNSTLRRKPELTKMKLKDIVVLNENFNKNEPRYNYTVVKIDFKKQVVLLKRDSGLDANDPKPQWVCFSRIYKIIKDEDFEPMNNIQWIKREENGIKDIPEWNMPLMSFLLQANAAAEYTYIYKNSEKEITELIPLNTEVEEQFVKIETVPTMTEIKIEDWDIKLID